MVPGPRHNAEHSGWYSQAALVEPADTSVSVGPGQFPHAGSGGTLPLQRGDGDSPSTSVDTPR